MGLFVVALLVILPLVLFISKRDRETLLIMAMSFALSEFWLLMLIYIAKKGGITGRLEGLLFGTHDIRRTLQYLIFTLKELGYLMAIGRTLFPLFFLWLALYYNESGFVRSNRWLFPAAAVLPLLSLLLYFPGVFSPLISRYPGWIALLSQGNLVWILCYLLCGVGLLVWQGKMISMPFYRMRFVDRCSMLLSLALLYGLYCPQDPAQVYLFYRNEYAGGIQGIWYLNSALNLGSYLFVFALVTACSLVGSISLTRYALANFQEGQEEISIQRKVAASSDAANVFVHSVKNQLLANQVLLKRMDRELNQEEPECAALREYHASLVQANGQMLSRVEEMYRTIRTNSMVMVPVEMGELLSSAQARLLRKYPEALLEMNQPGDGVVLGDQAQLAESLYNLLVNGWEAQLAAQRTEEPIQVTVTCERMWIVTEILDHGNGMSAAQRKHIFEPFYSSKNSSTNWGMGLYYVRKIVKAHYGLLRVETAPGKGCTFLMQLPRYSGEPRKQKR